MNTRQMREACGGGPFSAVDTVGQSVEGCNFRGVMRC